MKLTLAGAILTSALSQFGLVEVAELSYACVGLMAYVQFRRTVVGPFLMATPLPHRRATTA